MNTNLCLPAHIMSGGIFIEVIFPNDSNTLQSSTRATTYTHTHSTNILSIATDRQNITAMAVYLEFRILGTGPFTILWKTY